ncbi:MYG1 family protein [Weissella hellenica]|nr:MYG1 family protein [Weissella hellenica]
MYQQLVTHNGKFHADDVFASVILTQLFPELPLVRTRDEQITNNKNNFVYDVGGGEFDHHRIDDQRQHENGVPMAAFGLIWQKFSETYLKKMMPDIAPDLIMKTKLNVEKSFIIGIDALDNGVSTYQSPAFTISDAINDFYDEDHELESFKRAITFAKGVLDNRIYKTIAKLIAEKDVIDNATFISDEILLLPVSGPWKDYVEQFDKCRFVVMPRKDGNWMIQGVPVSHGSFEVKQPLPQLDKPWIIFIHRTGFMGVVDTKEHALLLAKSLVDNV